MTRYAESTSVPAAKSRAQIEDTLMGAGAKSFAYGITDAPPSARVMCDISGVRLRIDVPLPGPADREFTHTPTGQLRAEAGRRSAYDQEVRRRWRALLLVVKAKLEAVASGITTFEEEFLAHIVLPDGTTFWEWAKPQLARVYARQEMPALLPGGSRG